MSASSRLIALRALRDCGVVRASVATGAFVALYHGGDADRRTVRGDVGLADYRLTDFGRREAERLLGGGMP